MTSPTEISVQKLSKLIGTPNCPMIIDVRLADDFDDDRRLIPTARRYHFEDIEDLIPEIGDRSVIVTCQKGFKLSQGAAALLRTHSIAAETLKGGYVEWREAKLPLVNFDKIPFPTGKSHSVWVTKQRPKIDRIASPWLIRRFIDPNAQFLYVAQDQVELVAEKFNATPFDQKGVFWSHRKDRCTFDTMVEEFGLESDALSKMSEIIRGADTNVRNLAPECAGLLAISLGLSRMFKNDLEQLDAGMLVYDALYRWARDAVNEAHDSSSMVVKS